MSRPERYQQQVGYQSKPWGKTANPDVQAWEGWPARQTNLIFGGKDLGEKSYLDLWQKLEAHPTDPEVQRNIGIAQPLLWTTSEFAR